MKRVYITSFDIRGIVQFEFNLQGQQSTELIMWKYLSSYMKACIEKAPTTVFSTMTMPSCTGCYRPKMALVFYMVEGL
jgi:hypothetical protein